MKRTLRATTTDLISIDSFDEQDWQRSIMGSLNQPSSTVAAKELKLLLLLKASYHQGIGGVLAQVLSLTEAKDGLFRNHDLSSDEHDISLYRCLQRQGLA